MALTGEAKKNYQRDYMRRRRAALGVRPTLIALVKLDLTLDKCTKGLQNTNDNLEEVIRMVTENPNEVQYVEEDTPAIKIDIDAADERRRIEKARNSSETEILSAEELQSVIANIRGDFQLDIIPPVPEKTIEPSILILPQTIPGKTIEETADIAREIIQSNKATCSTCDGKGYREFEAGLIRLACPECRGKA